MTATLIISGEALRAGGDTRAALPQAPRTYACCIQLAAILQAAKGNDMPSREMAAWQAGRTLAYTWSRGLQQQINVAPTL